MFENLKNIFKKFNKKEEKQIANSKEAAKERLHLVLMQDRANVSADFLELMKQEIIEVIKKYIEVDEKAIDVRLTNKENTDGTNGAPALYANIPILNIKNEARKANTKENGKKEEKTEEQNSDKEQGTVQENQIDSNNNEGTETVITSNDTKNEEETKTLDDTINKEGIEETAENTDNISKQENTDNMPKQENTENISKQENADNDAETQQKEEQKVVIS